MKYSALSSHNKLLVVCLASVVKNGLCGAHKISEQQHSLLALWVSQHLGVRILLLQFNYLLHRELLMHGAGAVPQQHITAGNAVYVVTKVTVRAKDNLLILRQAVNYLTGVCRGHNYVCQSLHSRRCVDVRYYRMPRILFNELCELVCRAAVSKRAASLSIGNQNLFIWREYLGGLPHKMHAAHNNNGSVCLGSPLGQRQTVSHIVSYVLDCRLLIVVRHYHGVLLLTEAVDFFYKVHIHNKFITSL